MKLAYFVLCCCLYFDFPAYVDLGIFKSFLQIVIDGFVTYFADQGKI